MAENPRDAMVPAFVALLVTLVIMAVALFGSAGRLDWALGWWFIGVFVVLTIVAIVWIWRINPDIFVARSRLTRQGSKGWDVVLVSLLLACYLATLVVAGLDARFGWSAAPAWAIGLGYILFGAGYWGSGWAEAVNRHFEPTVRIQSDRGHQVVTTGPYAYVRHPGYISANLLTIGMALALGSFWALVPVVLGIVLLGIRTNLEDATLRRELPGYAEFAQKTRFRWIPGVW
jgi:protein-S-isoprenylcysteine O-methyltransferase Ste14